MWRVTLQDGGVEVSSTHPAPCSKIHWFGWLPRDESTYAEAWVSSREALILLYPHHSSPEVVKFSAHTDPFRWWFPHEGKREHSEHLVLQLCRTQHKGPHFPHLTQNTNRIDVAEQSWSSQEQEKEVGAQSNQGMELNE